MARDSELISRATSGDEEAFADLMRAYYAFAYRIVIEIVSNPHDAEEVVQDTFLNAYCGLGQIEERTRFRNWLAKIAKNRALNWQREQRADTVPIDDLIDSAVQAADSPGEQLVRDEELEMVWRAMNSLSQKDREIARSYYLEGASYDELIRAHGLSYKAISFRLSRAKRTLAKRLQYLLNSEFVPPVISLKKISSGGFTAMKIGTVPKITVGVIAIIVIVFIVSHQLLSSKDGPSSSIKATASKIKRPDQPATESDTSLGSVVSAPRRTDEPQISAEEMKQTENFSHNLKHRTCNQRPCYARRRNFSRTTISVAQATLIR
ncbi:MAG: sigma-70 family RNA polymerase sigma factor [Candidatus Poribacteria bacterium]|nr:sigma-70 family RNA polymerase sigma factor [Candidatus Poribacteria bacterium]MDE0503203.1 sigma-70 family RNA polymerase sigma factor [Candidatus Poribacteria bacterium]